MLLLSLLPILLILFLMVGLRWGGAQAGAAGYLSALLIAIIFFGAGPELLAYAHARALLLAVDVLLIIWAAFLLYRVADEAGAIRAIGQALPHLTPDRGMQALIIGWVFAAFLQGVGGFGVPVAVIAPILVGLGFAPLAAVVIPSIGHGWAVTFGSMGSSFQALLSSSGQSAELLAPPAALFLGLAGLLSGLLVAHAAGGMRAVRSLLLPILFLGLVMGSVQYVVAISGAWNIAAFTGGLAGLLVGIPLAYRTRRGANGAEDSNQNGSLDQNVLLTAISGYLALIVIILAIQLIPALKNWFGQVNIVIQFPEVHTSLGYITPASASRKLSIFSHTGAILFYASSVAYLIYRRAGWYQKGAAQRIIGGTLQRMIPSSVGILSMISMATIMELSGMTYQLAQGLAESMGRLFPIIAPWIGALGAFMTGSNTNSNVVFAPLQMRTAELLGYSAAVILAAQTSGAGLASVLAPAKVVVGASTAGMAGHEGDVMRKLLAYSGLLLVLISILSLIGVVINRQ